MKTPKLTIRLAIGHSGHGSDLPTHQTLLYDLSATLREAAGWTDPPRQRSISAARVLEIVNFYLDAEHAMMDELFFRACGAKCTHCLGTRFKQRGAAGTCCNALPEEHWRRRTVAEHMRAAGLSEEKAS